MSVERYKFLFLLIEQRKPRILLDIGVHNGKRSSQFIQTALKYSPDFQYFGFDLWEEMTQDEFQDEHLYPKKMKTKEEADLLIGESLSKSQYRLIQGNTRETLSDKTLPVADFIFIDGGHSLETISSDWSNCQRLMNDDTVVVFDDYWHGNYSSGCASLIDSLGPEYRVHLFGLDHIVENKKTLHIISLVKVQLRKEEK